MKTSEQVDKISAAIVAAQASLKNASLDKINPHFKNKYATLGNIRDTVTPVLAAQGLAIMQGTDANEMGYFVVTRMVHTSGQWIESRYPFAMDKPQQMGSAYTYARRYSLAAMCGIVGEDDDDGNAGQQGEAPKPAMAASNGNPMASKAKSRETFDQLIKLMRATTNMTQLTRWQEENTKAIESLPPDFVDELRNEFVDMRKQFERTAAA